MAYEERVHGVIVVSSPGADRFDADDETTLSIFAGYAAQALVNAANVERLAAPAGRARAPARRASGACSRSTSGCSRPSSPTGVLDLIADSLKAIVPYDSLTIYRVDRAAGVRRAVIARDRFAELILAHESPLGIGITGWVIDHGEAVLANEAHLDPRSVQVPGHAVRAGVDDRRPAAGRRRGHRHAEHRPDGRGGGALHRQRVRADQAVRRPGVDRAAERRGPRRGPGPRRAGRADRAAQPRRLPARARRGRRAGPSGGRSPS